MSRYILIRRLRGPAFLLLIGVIALLHQAGVVNHMWSLFWPIALILWGVLLLAERAALEVEGYPPNMAAPYPGTPYGGGPYPGAPNPPNAYPGAATPAGGPVPPPASTTSIVPAGSSDLERSNGEQS